MILLSIFQTVEFYVISATMAAAVIAAASLPSRRGAARTFLYAGELMAPISQVGERGGQGITVTIDENCRMHIHRFGLEGICESGAYSLSVKIFGFDVEINERLTPGRHGGEEMTQAEAVIDCFGRERYHFQYKSEATNRSCAFTLNIAAGNTINRPLDA